MNRVDYIFMTPTCAHEGCRFVVCDLGTPEYDPPVRGISAETMEAGPVQSCRGGPLPCMVKIRDPQTIALLFSRPFRVMPVRVWTLSVTGYRFTVAAQVKALRAQRDATKRYWRGLDVAMSPPIGHDRVSQSAYDSIFIALFGARDLARVGAPGEAS